LTPLDLVVWAKANAGAGNLYRSPHELLPLFTSEIDNDPRLPLVARNGPTGSVSRCPLIGVDRKSLAQWQTDGNDPILTSGPPEDNSFDRFRRLPSVEF
jgi:hypothetical protein